jgi:hypothetical protein
MTELPPPRKTYWDCTLVDGPSAGTRIPFHGEPRYGFCIEFAPTCPTCQQEGPTQIYKVSHNPAEAVYVGTMR